MKAVVAAFNQEKALVGAFSVITNLRIELFEALVRTLIVSSYHEFHEALESNNETADLAAQFQDGISGSIHLLREIPSLVPLLKSFDVVFGFPPFEQVGL